MAYGATENWLRHTQAPRWKFWMARLFGKQVAAVNAVPPYRLFRWRGDIYVIP